MDLTFRTLVRVFLVVGGLAYVVYGAVSWSPSAAVVGVLATVLGVFGLWTEVRSTGS